MAYKHCCVIDEQGYYDLTDNPYVLVTSDTGDYTDAVIHGHDLRPGEQLIDTRPPIGTVKPRWSGTAWTETATEEEIAAWEAAKPVYGPAPPSQVEQLAVEMTMAMAAMQLQHDMAMSEMQLQHDMTIAELTVAMAGGMEVNADV